MIYQSDSIPVQEAEGAHAPSSSELSFKQIAPMLLVAGLGFFVDVYDIVLFSVVRIPSLLNLKVPESSCLSQGVLLLNLQMTGMIIGGVIWGVLGDRRGRKSVLFGSILLYSLANVVNGFADNLATYGALRFLAGIGLAGEVGAAMTIAAEITPARYRAYGTAAVAGLGVFGAIGASYIGDVLPWRQAFITAGMAGLALLLARMSMKETPLFIKMNSGMLVPRGQLLMLISNSARLWRLVRCVLSAVPLWFAIGVIVSFAPEIARGASGGTAVLTVAAVAMAYSIGETSGEVAAGVASQLLHSRKLCMLIFLALGFASSVAVLLCPKQMYVALTLPLGFGVGYWGVLMTSTAEQFGTNLRATVTTLVPNLVRASAIPITLAFSTLTTFLGVTNAALLTGSACFLAALISILNMEETFAKDLDFLETH